MPTVSVLMVFHRDTPFLRPAIASVLGQTWRDLELVLVDNGTGLAAEALGDLARDARLRWVRLPANAGHPRGYNAAIAAARGEFIAILDSDDIALPHRIERQVAFLRAAPELVYVSALAHRIDAEGRVDGKVFSLVDPDEIHRYSQFDAPVVNPASMGRRELFAGLQYREEFPCAADYDFQARAAERGRIGVVPEVLLHYRWHPAQLTQSAKPTIERERAAIQFLTARRRAGQAENLPDARVILQLGPPPAMWRIAATYAYTGGFAELAAYQARRSFAAERTAGNLGLALQLFVLAWRAARDGRERGRATRMFFRGPVKALGLHPA